MNAPSDMHVDPMRDVSVAAGLAAVDESMAGIVLPHYFYCFATPPKNPLYIAHATLRFPDLNWSEGLFFG